MGKGKRLKLQRQNKVRESPAVAVPAQATGVTAAPAPKDFESQVTEFGRQLGATFLYSYLHLSLDLGDLGPLASLPEPEPGKEALYAEIAEKMVAIWESVGDYQITRHADNAANIFAKIAPIVQVPAMEQILAIGAEWLTESGYQPDHTIWFAGSRTYAMAMVPPAHRVQTLELLDWPRLHSTEPLTPERRLAAQLAGHSGSTAAFSLTGVKDTRWAFDAVVREPEAMLHAAAALVCWLWNEAGAVIDPMDKALAMMNEMLPALRPGTTSRKGTR